MEKYNLQGRKFGRLTAIKISHIKGQDVYWLCRCKCGTEKPVVHRSLLYNHNPSCGCRTKEHISKLGLKRRLAIKPGQKITKFLTTIKELELSSSGHRRWLCACKCNNQKVFVLQSLLRNPDLSCGCYTHELRIKAKTTHGKYGTSEYNAYRSMLQRCSDPNRSDYHRYGERGITVCQRWKESFQNFYDDLISSIGLRPSPKHSIDRIDNDGNYEPGNLKWSTKQEQANNRRSNSSITCWGRTQTEMQWERETGIDRRQIHRRIFEYHWNKEDALTLKPDNHRRYSTYKRKNKLQTTN